MINYHYYNCIVIRMTMMKYDITLFLDDTKSMKLIAFTPYAYI